MVQSLRQGKILGCWQPLAWVFGILTLTSSGLALATSAQSSALPSGATTHSAMHAGHAASARVTADKSQLPKPKATVEQPLDQIVAIVNNDIISQQQLQQEVAAARLQIRQAKAAMPSTQVLHKQVLEQLILKSIQLQLAKRASIQVSPAQVQNAIQTVAKNNRMTVSQLKQQLALTGMSYAHYKQQIKQQIKISQLQQMMVGRSVNVTPQEVKIAQQQMQALQPLSYHVGDILISLPENPTAQQLQAAQSKARAVLAKLKAPGADFKKVAVSTSAGAQVFKGGDMGWLTVADMPSLFVPVVTKLQVGQVSAPLRAPNGLHLLTVFAQRAVHGHASKQEIEMQLRQRKFQENLALWLQQLRDTAYVKVMLPGYKSLSSDS